MVIVRGLVAALLVLHVLLEQDALARAALFGIAAVAAGLFVVSSVLALVVHARVHGSVARDRWTGLVVLLDAIALITVARVTVGVDPSASIAWCFVLWTPFSLAVLFPPVRALLGTLIVAGLVLSTGSVSFGELEPLARQWTSIGVPAALVVVAGLLAITAQRAVRLRGQLLVDQLVEEQDRTARLRDADDLKNTFLAAVSHELRTPLTSILGFALTVLDRPDIDEQQRTRMLRTIVEEAEHLEDILANLLDLDRLTRGKATLVLVETDPATIIQSVVTRLRTRTGRDVSMDIETGPRVHLDAAKVERIVENLIGNAVKYTQPDAPIEVRLRYEAHGVTIRVDDGGPGISADLREGIFEPFRRGSDVGVPGTGIGLSLVDRFSRMHGGRAWVEERPGGGCRFQVYLPSPRHGAGCEPEVAQRASAGGAADAVIAYADAGRD